MLLQSRVSNSATEDENPMLRDRLEAKQYERIKKTEKFH